MDTTIIKKDYIRARSNEWRSWKDFQITIERLNSECVNYEEVENRKEFKKALLRWQKWNAELNKQCNLSLVK